MDGYAVQVVIRQAIGPGDAIRRCAVCEALAGADLLVTSGGLVWAVVTTA